MTADDDVNDSPGASLTGLCLLVSGCLGLLLMLAARSGGLPLRWSMTILAYASLWGLGSLLLVAGGMQFLWRAQHSPVAWKPERPGQRFRTLVVYVRPECCLCEEALELLSRYHPWLPPAIEVAIDDEPELQERFQESIPVVECDGKIRFRGRVSELLLRRLIDGTPPLSDQTNPPSASPPNGDQLSER